MGCLCPQPAGVAGVGVGEVDRAIAAIAERQGGHVTAEQLAALALSRRAVQRRLQRGFLIAVFRGVYAVGRLPTLAEDQAKGALLAMGDGAALSPDSAAYLHGYFTSGRTRSR